MFSSFTKSIVSMASGPRAMIASQIALVLGEYFVVNPDDIESSLLSDAKIVLRDTQIRKKEYRDTSGSTPDTVVTVSGIVEEVIFSWKWSFSSTAGGTSISSSSRGAGMVQDAALSIRGLKVIIEFDRRVSEVNDDDVLNISTFSSTSSEPTKVNENNSEKVGFLQNYIQQIVDHLTVKVDKFEITFQGKDGPCMVIHGRDLALVTLASAKVPSDGSVATKTILSQQISLGIFAIDVKDNEEEYSLIEPFGYTASVTRLFGKRFQDGIFSGLDVTGLPNDEDKVKIHVGTPQIHVLCTLAMYMAPTTCYKEKGNCGAKEQSPYLQPNSHSTNEGDGSTIFTFPLPEVTLVISQDIATCLYDPSEISIPSLVVSFRSDGGIFRVEGSGDVDCDGSKMLKMSNDAFWDLDFVKQTFTIKQKHDIKKDDKAVCDSFLLTLVANEEWLRPLVTNFQSAMNNNEVKSLMVAFERSDNQLETLEAPSRVSKPWVISVDSDIRLIVESNFGGTRDVVERMILTARSIRVIAAFDTSKGSYTLNEVDCGGIELTSNTDKGTLLVVPTFRLANNILSLSGIIDLKMQSADKGRELQDFALRFKCIFADSRFSDESAKDYTIVALPFDVIMTGARFSLSEGPGLRLAMGRLQTKGNVLSLASLEFSADEGLHFESRNLRGGLNFSDPLNISLGIISNLTVPDLFRLHSPIKNTLVTFSNKSISIILPELHGCISLQDGSRTSSSARNHPQYLPEIDVQLVVKKLVLELSHQHPSCKKCGEVQLSGLSISACSLGPEVSLISNRRIDVVITDAKKQWIQGSVSPFRATANIEKPSKVFSFSCDGGVDVSSSSFGKFEVTVASLNVPRVKNEFRTPSELVIGQIITTAENQSLLESVWEMICTIGGGNDSEMSSETKAPYDLPFSILITDVKFSVTDQASTLNIVRCRLDKNCVVCEAVLLNYSDEAKCRFRDVEIFLNGSIDVNIGMIDEIFVLGSVSLLETVPNVRITMKDDALKVAFNEVQLKLLSADKKGSASTPIEAECGGNINVLNFPYSVGIDVVNLILWMDDDDARYKVEISDASINMVVEDGVVSIDTYGITSTTFYQCDDYIKISFLPSLFSVYADTFLLNSMCLGGMIIGPSSLGYLEATIPTLTTLPDSRQITSDNAITLTVESYEVIQKFQHLALQILTKAKSMNYSSDDYAGPSSDSYWSSVSVQLPSFELRIQEPLFSVLQVDNVHLSLKRSIVKSLAYHQEKGIVAKFQEISIAFQGSDMIATIEEIYPFTVPNFLMLTEPTYGISAKYDSNHLLLDINSLKCNIPVEDYDERLSNQHPSNAMSFCLPLPIEMRMKSFTVESSISNVGISIQNIETGFKPDGPTILIQTERELKFKLYQSTESWLEADMKTISALVGFENGVLDIKGFECAGLDVGPTSQSCGNLRAVIPHCSHDGEMLIINNFVNISIHSVDAANNALSLVQNLSSLIFTSSASFELPFPIALEGIKISLSEPMSNIVILTVEGASTKILFSKFDAYVVKTACLSADNIAINLQSLELEVETINSFTMTDVFSLSKPTLRCKMTYGSSCCISLPSEVQIEMLPSLEQSSPSSEECEVDSKKMGHEISLPVQIYLNRLTVINIGRDMNFSVCNVHMATRPSNNWPNDFQCQAPSTYGTDLTLNVGNASCELFELNAMKVSLLLPSRDFGSLRNLKVAFESVKVTAGFSNIDWTTFFTQKSGNSAEEKLVVFHTPFPEIDSFPLSVSYKGKVLSTRSNIQLTAFRGDATTTSEHIIRHYTNVVLKRIPGFLTNVEFLGENLIDSSLRNTGMAVAGRATKTLTGAGLGSVAGVALGDAIRAGIDSGKKSRNANTSDGYKFGDFTRGIIHGTRENAKIGAQMRGDPGTYVPGDLVVGSSKSIGKYVNNNQAKLSAAGGAGIGATVGLAVAGPLGFFAGSYLGGQAMQGIGDDGIKGQSNTKDAVKVKPNATLYNMANIQKPLAVAQEVDRQGNPGQSNIKVKPNATLYNKANIQKPRAVHQEVDRQLQSLSKSSLPTTKTSNLHHNFAKESNASYEINPCSQSGIQVDFLSGSPCTRGQHEPPPDSGLFLRSSFDSPNETPSVEQIVRHGRTLPNNSGKDLTESPPRCLAQKKIEPGVFDARDTFDFFTDEIPFQDKTKPSPAHKDASNNINFGKKTSSDLNKYPPSDYRISADTLSQDSFNANAQQMDFLTTSTCRVDPHHTSNSDTSTTGDYDFFNDRPIKQSEASHTGSGPSSAQRQHHAGWASQKPTNGPPARPQTNTTKKDGYKFGDITKSIIANGKKSDGRKKDSSYKFGDFTRGLFS